MMYMMCHFLCVVGVLLPLQAGGEFSEGLEKV